MAKVLNGINWEELQLPAWEDEDAAEKRLQELHANILRENGVPTVPDIGSPGFRPCAEQAREVACMTALGLSEQEIALVLNIEQHVLKRYYRKELVIANNLANAMVAKTALGMAISGRYPAMTQFWLKSRAKWKETSAVELTGKDGAPLDGITPKEKLDAVLAGIAANNVTGKAPSKKE